MWGGGGGAVCRGGVSGVVMGGGGAASGGRVAHNGVSEFRPKKKGRTIKAVTRAAGGDPHSSLSAEGFLEGCRGVGRGARHVLALQMAAISQLSGAGRSQHGPASSLPPRPALPGCTSPQGR